MGALAVGSVKRDVLLILCNISIAQVKGRGGIVSPGQFQFVGCEYELEV